MRDLFFISLILSNTLLLASFIYGIYKYRSNKFVVLNWLLAYLAVVLSIEIVNKFSIYILRSEDTSYTYPFYIALEFFTLSQMLAAELKLSRIWRNIFIGICVLLFVEGILLWRYDKVFGPSFSLIFSRMFFVIGSGYILLKEIAKRNTPNPILLVYEALLFYYLVSLFLFLVLNQLSDIEVNSSYVLWSINNLLSLILYVSSFYAFYRLNK